MLHNQVTEGLNVGKINLKKEKHLKMNIAVTIKVLCKEIIIKKWQHNIKLKEEVKVQK